MQARGPAALTAGPLWRESWDSGTKFLMSSIAIAYRLCWLTVKRSLLVRFRRRHGPLRLRARLADTGIHAARITVEATAARHRLRPEPERTRADVSGLQGIAPSGTVAIALFGSSSSLTLRSAHPYSATLFVCRSLSSYRRHTELKVSRKEKTISPMPREARQWRRPKARERPGTLHDDGGLALRRNIGKANRARLAARNTSAAGTIPKTSQSHMPAHLHPLATSLSCC